MPIEVNQQNGTATPIGIVGIAPTEGMHGYVLVARDGAVYGFGKGRDEACAPKALPHCVYVASVATDYRAGGYWVAETDGLVAAFHAPSWPFKAVKGLRGEDAKHGYLRDAI